MRNVRLIALCFVLVACGSSGEGTGTGGTGAGGSSGTTGAAGTTAGSSGGGNAGRGGSSAGSGGGSAGTTGAAGTTAGSSGGGNAGRGGSSAGSGGNAGGGGGAGRGGSNAGSGGNAGGGGATGGRGGAGGNAGSGGAGTGGGAGSGGRGGAGASGGRGGSGGSGGGAGGRGGGAGSPVDGGSDGGGAFNPCPTAGTACKIMPLGDSITFGVGSSGSGGGYRVPLFRQTLTNSELITFVGHGTAADPDAPNGPTTVDGVAFPRNHEGYSGYTIDTGGGRTGISTIIDAAFTANTPHIVLLMIGTNDVNISLDLANASTRLGNLIDRILTYIPNGLLVVARITPTKTAATNTRVQTYNNAIPTLVQSRAAAGKHIITVDMYAAFTANSNYMTALMNDDLHPNDAGYMVMAQTWYAAIRDYLR